MASETRIGTDMKCPQCGGECKWIADASAKVCTRCGYQENIPDSDAVRIARIAAYKEIELAKMQHDQEKKAARSKLLHEMWPMLFLAGLLLFSVIMAGISKIF